MKCVLNVTLTDNSEMSHNFDGSISEKHVLIVRQRLRGCNDNTLTRVESHGIEILHVTHRDAVVLGISHYFVLALFPSSNISLHKNLR